MRHRKVATDRPPSPLLLLPNKADGVRESALLLKEHCLLWHKDAGDETDLSMQGLLLVHYAHSNNNEQQLDFGLRPPAQHDGSLTLDVIVLGINRAGVSPLPRSACGS